MADNKDFWFPFYSHRWLNDFQLSQCSASTRGIWIDMIALMNSDTGNGILVAREEIFLRSCRCSKEKFNLFIKEAMDIKFCDISVTVTPDESRIISVMSRRIFRESKQKKKLREQGRLRQKKHREKLKGNAKVTYNNNAPVTGDNKINKNIYSPTSIENRLAVLLLKEIKNRKPDYKRVDIQTWSKHIDLMIRIDKRDPEEIENIIKWCQQDDFWQNNILSTEKLRKQFDQLSLKMKKQTQNNKPVGKCSMCGRLNIELNASGECLMGCNR